MQEGQDTCLRTVNAFAVGAASSVVATPVSRASPGTLRLRQMMGNLGLPLPQVSRNDVTLRASRLQAGIPA